MPTRTCVVCRRSASKGELLRVVLSKDGLVVDERSKLPGRGAYLHRTGGCGAIKGVVDRLFNSIRRGSTRSAEPKEGVGLTAEQRQRFEAELGRSESRKPMSGKEVAKTSPKRLRKLAGIKT